METALPVTAFSGNVTPTINYKSSPTSYTEYYYYPDENSEPCEYGGSGAKYLPFLYSIIFVLGLLGNSLVIWVTICGVRLRSMTDVCLLNLAIADLLLVCSLPFLAHQARDQWLFGDAMCKVILGIYNIVFYCGIFFICLMSIDRYLAIVHAVYALRARTRSFGLVAAAVTWVAGFLASFPDLIFLKLQIGANSTKFCAPEYPSPKSSDESDESDDSFSSLHFWGVFSLFKKNILGLLVPALIMGFCYSQIVWRLLYCQSPKKQAIRLVLAVVVVFLCCWLPYNVALFFKALELLDVYSDCGKSQAIRSTLEVTETIAYAHSCLNPILYVFVGEKFRRHLVRLINTTPCWLCQVFKVHIPRDRRGSLYSQTTSVDERSTAV
ncbi:C-C chemokine receptor type 4 [Pleuronectes platessa]|uniref:C-C chemokine receptor type 4 n=1 Tax=Pleuronectes platessa TaxID=8262 RepID=UPI00232A2418|nr:C-C chemokine receptor type 4 [Pleuronectes platessa]